MALQLDRLLEAADDLTKVLDFEPLSLERFRRAQLWVRLGRFQEALADLDRLIAHYPTYWTFYDLRSQVHERLGHTDEARADLKRSLEFPRAGAAPLNNAAWRLATGPLEMRDPARAVALARNAVAMAPGTQVSLNTLGVALYRAGEFSEAVSTLEQSLQAGKGEFDAFDLFFLAMAHHRIGHGAAAKSCFERAVRWVQEHKNLDANHARELADFHAEAAAVLSVPAGELPDNVFAQP